jgi:hypothetical protein
MQSSPNHAPWQAGPVGTTGRISAAALFALAIDSVFTRQLAPHWLVALAITLVPALLAIRVVRALPGSLERAAIAFGAAALGSVTVLTISERRYPNQIIAALLVAGVVSATGLTALAIRWAREDRIQPAVIALTRSAEHSAAVAQRR